jgi:hypothetical protein
MYFNKKNNERIKFTNQIIKFFGKLNIKFILIKYLIIKN